MSAQNPHHKTRVLLLFGGRSGEHEVSLASAHSILQALDKSRYDVSLIGISKSGRWHPIDSQAFLENKTGAMKFKIGTSDSANELLPCPSENRLVAIDGGNAEYTGTFDVVFPVLHGTFGEDGTMQGLLELSGLPYVGSGVIGSAASMDKDISARLLSQAQIPVVPYICIRQSDWVRNSSTLCEQIESQLKLPVFVKPANAGSSVGVSKVKSSDKLVQAIEFALKFDVKILIQKAIPARELEVSVLGNENPRASVVGEVIPRHEFYSYEAKYLDEKGADFAIPAMNIPATQIEEIRRMAVRAFEALECRGLARVDFFLDKSNGSIYLNELNTIPGFTKISQYPKLWEATGLTYPQLLDELISLAIQEHERKSKLQFSI